MHMLLYITLMYIMLYPKMKLTVTENMSLLDVANKSLHSCPTLCSPTYLKCVHKHVPRCIIVNNAGCLQSQYYPLSRTPGKV